jgi:hypothetical protein
MVPGGPQRKMKMGSRWRSVCPWADSPSDQGSIWRQFLFKLIEVDNPALIHYGSFETLFLKAPSLLAVRGVSVAQTEI